MDSCLTSWRARLGHSESILVSIPAGGVFLYHWGWPLDGEQLSIQINLSGGSARAAGLTTRLVRSSCPPRGRSRRRCFCVLLPPRPRHHLPKPPRLGCRTAAARAARAVRRSSEPRPLWDIRSARRGARPRAAPPAAGGWSAPIGGLPPSLWSRIPARRHWEEGCTPEQRLELYVRTPILPRLARPPPAPLLAHARLLVDWGRRCDAAGAAPACAPLSISRRTKVRRQGASSATFARRGLVTARAPLQERGWRARRWRRRWSSGAADLESGGGRRACG